MPTCTYCQGTEFLAGPSGGASTNILCANPACRHWFNYTPMLPPPNDMDDLKHVEPTQDEAEIEAHRKREANAAKQSELRLEGARIYEAGLGAENCFTEPNYADAARATNVMRLAGYINAHVAATRKYIQ